MTELWCVHIIGPDEVHAATSLAEAIRAAHRFNTWTLDRASNPPESADYVLLWANVDQWPHDPASHAHDVATRNHDSIFAEAARF